MEDFKGLKQMKKIGVHFCVRMINVRNMLSLFSLFLSLALNELRCNVWETLVRNSAILFT